MLDKFLPENDLVKTSVRKPNSARRAFMAVAEQAIV